MTAPADCAAPARAGTYGGSCSRRAAVIIGDVPMCMQHANAAKRASEEAAWEAERRERECIPTPAQPWRGDAEWQALKREMDDLDKDPGLNADERMLRAISLAMRMAEVEERYEA